MTLTEHHTDSSWRFRWWRTPQQQMELEFVVDRERWLRALRVESGGWADQQQVKLPIPEDCDDAKRIATEHAGEAP